MTAGWSRANATNSSMASLRVALCLHSGGGAPAASSSPDEIEATVKKNIESLRGSVIGRAVTRGWARDVASGIDTPPKQCIHGHCILSKSTGCGTANSPTFSMRSASRIDRATILSRSSVLAAQQSRAWSTPSPSPNNSQERRYTVTTPIPKRDESKY